MKFASVRAPKVLPENEFFKLGKFKFWEWQFFSIVAFKEIFGIPLLINLFMNILNWT